MIFSIEFLNTRNILVPVSLDPVTHRGITDPETFSLIQRSVKVPNGLENYIHYSTGLLKMARVYIIEYYGIFLFCYKADDAAAIQDLANVRTPFLNKYRIIAEPLNDGINDNSIDNDDWNLN